MNYKVSVLIMQAFVFANTMRLRCLCIVMFFSYLIEGAMSCHPAISIKIQLLPLQEVEL